MKDPGERLITIGGRLLIEQSSSLIALIDPRGGLIETNPRLQQILALQPDAQSILTLLDPSSRPRFHKQIQQALAEQRAGPTTLNFTENPTAIPQSYRCYLTAAADSQLVLLAEPIAALDQHGAEEYMRVTSELSTTTRSLQKISYELTQKQHMLEDALAKIELIAHVDELTQLLNRRSIMLRLTEEVDRAKRYSSAVSILMIDIDHFKQVNDRYGHQVGDKVLRSCARLLRQSTRSTDYLGRYGGEEFLCVLPMTSEEAAVVLSERLRFSIEHAPFAAGATAFPVTISVGAAELDRQRDTFEQLLSHADSALYQAKANGRNRVEVWRA
ncbi:sensor domain-containing diguanylate cyclase [Chloroflexales bacterium ZM16-3]|nr:sensor domain-containing diguanylate cyclase [Chloroflexales bacterium ZM16-3]